MNRGISVLCAIFDRLVNIIIIMICIFAAELVWIVHSGED